MSITITDLGYRAPEYVGFSDTDRFNALKTLAECQISEDYFGCQYDDAVILLIAHMLAVGDRGGVSGSVKKDKVGDVEREWSSASTYLYDSVYSTTSYGLEFLRLRNSLLKTPLMMGIDRACLTW